ncbi:MAG: hypothetical protein ACKVOU_11125 [Cytophagales bacterium]
MVFKFAIAIGLIAVFYFGFRKKINLIVYNTIFKQDKMLQNEKFIVQYVGFSTDLKNNEFIERWSPFANHFKSAGIISIDLYQVKNTSELSYISRNVWKSSTYFENFPSGVAGSGSGGGVKVTQFGGYWLLEGDLEKKDKMNIAFLEVENIKVDHNITVRNRCTSKVKYIQMIEHQSFQNHDNEHTISNQFICNHLKTM